MCTGSSAAKTSAFTMWFRMQDSSHLMRFLCMGGSRSLNCACKSLAAPLLSLKDSGLPHGLHPRKWMRLVSAEVGGGALEVEHLGLLRCSLCILMKAISAWSFSFLLKLLCMLSTRSLTASTRFVTSSTFVLIYLISLVTVSVAASASPFCAKLAVIFTIMASGATMVEGTSLILQKKTKELKWELPFTWTANSWIPVGAAGAGTLAGSGSSLGRGRVPMSPPGKWWKRSRSRNDVGEVDAINSMPGGGG